ncbi:MAG: hypothetical protein M5R36_02280 [Deltaproteobacteria bacterium]|nr:hypothetical protein [Deltaproteobacteria bacterium]
MGVLGAGVGSGRGFGVATSMGGAVSSVFRWGATFVSIMHIKIANSTATPTVARFSHFEKYSLRAAATSCRMASRSE